MARQRFCLRATTEYWINALSRAHGFTVVFDREGYSPEWFEQLGQKRLAILTEHQFPQEAGRSEEFAAHRLPRAGGETVTMQRAERGTPWPNRLWVRAIRQRTASGHPTALLTTNFPAPAGALAGSLSHVCVFAS